jgi:hypothetical protein
MREQKLIFQCPVCRVALRLNLDTSRPPEIRFSSDDLTALDRPLREQRGLPVLVLYADLPVHLDWLGPQQAEQVFPFIQMTQLWGDRAAEYAGRSNSLYDMRLGVFPAVRRTASLYQIDDAASLDRSLENFPLGEIDDLADQHAYYRLGRLVDVLYVPFADALPRAAAINEVLARMVAAHYEHTTPYRELLDALVVRHGFIEHRRKVVETAMEVLEHADALLPGLAWEHIVDPKPDPSTFRIVRADFNELRGRYVEIFELASRSLAYVGAILNLVDRGDPTRWSNGREVTVDRMLAKRAVQREFILDELPYAKALYDDVHRQSRNAFGHYAVEYDFSSGELVDRDGSRTSYVLFLVDYLAAARLTGYLLGVVEKLSLDVVDAESEHRRVGAAQRQRPLEQGGDMS